MKRRRTPVLALLLVAALLLGACGGGDVSDDPAAALREAVEALGDYEGLELRLQVRADDTARNALRDDGVEQSELDLVLNSSLRLRVTGEEESSAVEVTAVLSGSEVLSLRFIDEDDLYLRLDFPALINALDDPLLREEAEELLEFAQFFGLEDVADAARTGRWLRVSGLQQLTDFLDAFDESPAPSEPSEADLEALAAELVESTVRFLDDDVTVTFVAEEAVGDRVRVSTTGPALERLLGDVVRSLGSLDLLDGVSPDELLAEISEDMRDVGTVSVDAWLSGGRLVQIGLDANELADDTLTGEPLAGELLLLIGIDEFQGEIEAPSDATELNLFSLLGGFAGGFDPFGADPFGDDPFGDDPGFPDGMDYDPMFDGPPMTSDPFLASLVAACDAGDFEACDDLYWESDLGSPEEAWADSCGGRQPLGTGQFCVDAFGGNMEGDGGSTGTDTGGDTGGSTECITQQELDDIGQFLGQDELDQILELIDQGWLEIC